MATKLFTKLLIKINDKKQDMKGTYFNLCLKKYKKNTDICLEKFNNSYLKISFKTKIRSKNENFL